MKITYAVFLLAFICSHLSAQDKTDAPVLEGKKFAFKNEPRHVIGTDNEKNTWFLRYDKNTTILDKYDRDMKFVVSQTLGDKDLRSPQFKVVNGKMYLFGININAPGKPAIEGHEILTGTSASLADGVKLGDADMGSKQKPAINYLIVSNDGSKFCWLIATNNSQYKTIGLHAIVFDSKFKVMWEHDIPMVKDVQTPEAPILDNDGNLYYLSSSAKRQSLFTAANFADWIWQVHKIHDATARDFTLKLRTGYIGKAIMAPYKEGVIVAGVYTGGKGTDVKGAFSLKLDGDGKTIDEKENEGFDKFITKEIKGTNSGSWDLTLSNLMPLDDGGFVWTVHQYFNSSNGSAVFVLSEICLKINADNSFGYVTGIPMEHVAGMDFDDCRHAVAYKNNLYVVYADEPANVTETTPAKLKALNTAQYHTDLFNTNAESLIVAKVNNDGTYKKAAAITDNISAYEIQLKDLAFIDNNQLYIACKADKKKPQPKGIAFKLN